MTMAIFFCFLVTLTVVHLGTHGGKSMIKRACSQRNESRSESGFESWSALWFGLWFELCAFTCIANAVPITNRICTLRGNILFLLRSPRWFLASARISKMRTHKSHSERALCSYVLGIRLSMRIMIQKRLFFCISKRVSKAWFERALRSQRVKSKGPNQFVIRSFVNRPNVRPESMMRVVFPKSALEIE